MPFLTLTAANGVPAMIDWPTMTMPPADQPAVIVQCRFEPMEKRGDSARPECRPRASIEA